MKDLSLLVWLTQLGLSIAAPLAGFVLVAIWLREQFAWGNWVVWVGVVLGIGGAIDGLRSSLQILNRMGKKKPRKEDPVVSFNEHE